MNDRFFRERDVCGDTFEVSPMTSRPVEKFIFKPEVTYSRLRQIEELHFQTGSVVLTVTSYREIAFSNRKWCICAHFRSNEISQTDMTLPVEDRYLRTGCGVFFADVPVWNCSEMRVPGGFIIPEYRYSLQFVDVTTQRTAINRLPIAVAIVYRHEYRYSRLGLSVDLLPVSCRRVYRCNKYMQMRINAWLIPTWV